MAKKTKKTNGVRGPMRTMLANHTPDGYTRADAVADVQLAIEACRKTAPNPACMSGVLLDDYANDLVRVIGLVAAARHNEATENLDTKSLDKALGDLNELRIALGFAHQALVDAGVVEAEGGG